MTHEVRLGADAVRDIEDGASFYESARGGLGRAFVVAVRDTTAKASEFPLKHREVDDGVRVALVDRFPWGVFFAVRGSLVTVLAVRDLRSSDQRRLSLLRKRLQDAGRR